MNVMNPENIFNLFPDPDKIPDDKIEANVIESAHYRIGMFTKIILGQKNFLRRIENFFDRAGKKINMEEHEKQSKFVVYNRAWYYIKDINLEEKAHVLDLVVHDIYDISYALHLAIKYFEIEEQYERCAHMFKIQQFLEEFEATNDGNMTFAERIQNNLEK